MERIRVKLIVCIDLDPVPGMMHTAESAEQVISGLLERTIPHYHPEVSIEGEVL